MLSWNPWWDVWSPCLKTNPPLYTCVSHPLFWANWLLLTLTEYPWPFVCVPVTKKYWASNGPCFHNRLSNTAFDYKVKNALKKGGRTSLTMVTQQRGHACTLCVGECSHSSKIRTKEEAFNSCPRTLPNKFPNSPTQRKTMAGGIHNHFMMQMTTVDLSGTPNAEEAFWTSGTSSRKKKHTILLHWLS